MELSFYYRSTLLGCLEKTENGYSYTSNITNEQKLINQMHLSKNNYNLFNSCKRESEALFSEFKRLITLYKPDGIASLISYREGGCYRGCSLCIFTYSILA